MAKEMRGDPSGFLTNFLRVLLTPFSTSNRSCAPMRAHQGRRPRRFEPLAGDSDGEGAARQTENRLRGRICLAYSKRASLTPLLLRLRNDLNQAPGGREQRNLLFAASDFSSCERHASLRMPYLTSVPNMPSPTTL